MRILCSFIILQMHIQGVITPPDRAENSNARISTAAEHALMTADPAVAQDFRTASFGQRLISP